MQVIVVAIQIVTLVAIAILSVFLLLTVFRILRLRKMNDELIMKIEEGHEQ
jgi:multisubunit Na+/H+ antiporter MnhF subunit